MELLLERRPPGKEGLDQMTGEMLLEREVGSYQGAVPKAPVLRTNPWEGDQGPSRGE